MVHRGRKLRAEARGRTGDTFWVGYSSAQFECHSDCFKNVVGLHFNIIVHSVYMYLIVVKETLIMIIAIACEYRHEILWTPDMASIRKIRSKSDSINIEERFINAQLRVLLRPDIIQIY
jgi:hypothetical protein